MGVEVNRLYVFISLVLLLEACILSCSLPVASLGLTESEYRNHGIRNLILFVSYLCLVGWIGTICMYFALFK